MAIKSNLSSFFRFVRIAIANGLTPDISVFLKNKNKMQLNFFEDIARFPERPILAIAVVPASQIIQEIFTKPSYRSLEMIS